MELKKTKIDPNLNKDCSSLLTQANREIKSLNYKLLRIISNDDSHMIVHPLRNNNVEIIQDTQMFCKVNVRGFILPAKF